MKMQIDKIAYFFGYSSFLVYFFPLVISSRFCSVTRISGIYTANCAYRGRVVIPHDLDPDIKVLILSHNNIEHIHEDSFSNYRNLIELYLNDNTLMNNSLHKNSFSPLKYLKLLDISFLRHHAPLELNWPASIESLSVNKNRNQCKIDLSEMPKLRILNAIDCSLLYFPLFHESASVEVIDLSKNSLNHFSVVDLAPLCQLRKLFVQWNSASTLNGTERWCDCFKIGTWLQQRGIETNKLNCSKPEKINSLSCDLSFQKETQIFEQCSKKMIKVGQIVWYLFFVLILICIVVLVFIRVWRFRM